MNWVDYSILAIVGVSVAISLWRGFTREALSLAGWILALWVALSFAAHLEILLEPHISAQSLRLPVAFVILFIATLFLAGLVSFLASQLVKKTGLSGTDRMAGVFFGVARGCFVVVVLVLIGGMTPMPKDDWWQDSLFLHYFEDMALWVRDFLPPEVAERIHYGHARQLSQAHSA